MTVIIRPDQGDPDELSRVAAILIGAAADPREVRLETFGDGPYFVVPDEVAKKAQLNQPETEESKPEPKASKKRKDQN